MMKKSILLLCILLCAASCTQYEDDIQEVVKPNSDVSLSSDGITMTVGVKDCKGEYATFTGKLSYLTDAFVTDLLMGIQYSTDKDMKHSVTELQVTEVDINNVYVVETDRIRFGEKYYYRPFIRINGITKYGKIDFFETMPFEPPKVTVKSTTSSTVTFKLENLLPTKDWKTNNFLLLDVKDDLQFTTAIDGNIMDGFSANRQYSWRYDLDLNSPETKTEEGPRLSWRFAYDSTIEIEVDGLLPGTQYYYCTGVYSEVDGRAVYSEPKTVVTGDYSYVEGVYDLSEKGTANCYPVYKDGVYKFKATKGNSDYLIPDIDHVEVLWEINESSLLSYWSTYIGEVIKVASYKDGYVFFEPNHELNSDSTKRGSAIIGAIDESGNILWSWHIWVCNDPIEEVSLGSVIVMDRNLGGLPYMNNKVLTGGMVYQWGRKDPFPAPQYGMGEVEDIRNQASRKWPENVHAKENGNLSYAIAHPMTIIESAYDCNYDWIYSGTLESDGYRWQSFKTIYDPCPVGWKVPDVAAWKAMDLGKFYHADNSMIVGETAFPLFPHGNYSEYGYYWSSSVESSSVYAYAPKFETRYSSNKITLDSPKAKSDLCYVRCVKDGTGYAGGSIVEEIVEHGVNGNVYRVTGYITNITNWAYGNYYIKDYSGELYIYGTLDSNGHSKQFADMRINEGDIVTVTGTYNKTYNELVDVTVERHFPVRDVTVEEFLNCPSSTDLYYRLNAKVSDILDSSTGNLIIEDETGSISVSGVASGWGGSKNDFPELDIQEGSKISLVGRRGDYDGNPILESAFCTSVSNMRMVKKIHFEYPDNPDKTQTLSFEYDSQDRIDCIIVSDNGKESYKERYNYAEDYVAVSKVQTVNGENSVVIKSLYELNAKGLPVRLQFYPEYEYGTVGRFTFLSDGKVKELTEDSGEVVCSAVWNKGNMTKAYSYSDIEEVFDFEYYDIENKANIEFSSLGDCGGIFCVYGFDRNVFGCFTNRSLLKECSLCEGKWSYEFDDNGCVIKFIEDLGNDDGCIGYVTYME